MATIVIVEDMLDVAEFYKTCLTLRGHNVFVAHTFSQASSFLDNHNVDILVTDYSLPDGNASEFMHKRNGKLPSVTILITGYADIDIGIEFAAYLTKPVMCDDICAAIKTHYEERTSCNES